MAHGRVWTSRAAMLLASRGRTRGAELDTAIPKDPIAEPKHMTELVPAADASANDACRRRGDRRRTSLKSVTLHTYRGRRRHPRRLEDREGSYLDWHQPHLLAATLCTLLLSCTDAILTLNILGRGGSELNWFMAVLIEHNIHLFAGVKMALSGSALIVLVMHANFRVFRVLRGWHLIYMVLPMYVVLVLYELFLLSL